MQQLDAGGKSVWVLVQGAVSKEVCGCEEGTKPNNIGACVSCGEGLDCVGMGTVLIKPGYSAEASSDNELSVFKCHGLSMRCKGGLPGETCAEGRVGVSCAECRAMTSPSTDNDGTCIACEGHDTFPFILCMVFALMMMVLVYRFIDVTDHSKQSPWPLLGAMTFSILITQIQNLGILQMMQIPWPEPLRVVLQIIRVLLVDVNVLP